MVELLKLLCNIWPAGPPNRPLLVSSLSQQQHSDKPAFDGWIILALGRLVWSWGAFRKLRRDSPPPVSHSLFPQTQDASWDWSFSIEALPLASTHIFTGHVCVPRLALAHMAILNMSYFASLEVHFPLWIFILEGHLCPRSRILCAQQSILVRRLQKCLLYSRLPEKIFHNLSYMKL